MPAYQVCNTAVLAEELSGQRKMMCVMGLVGAQELACRRGWCLTARAGGGYPGLVGQWVLVWGNLETTSGTRRLQTHVGALHPIVPHLLAAVSADAIVRCGEHWRNS
jgi:hypothetical protein